MTGLAIVNARLVTLAGPPPPRRGAALRDLAAIERGAVRVEGDRITDVVAGAASPARPGDEVVDAAGRVVMPGFVDCHTHACWAGDRLDEFEMKLGGAAYLDILAAGGGIMSTVRAVRAATEDELAAGLAERLERLAALGTTTVEVKSGYGLERDAELAMLRAIARAGAASPLDVVPTFLGAHAIDPDRPAFVDHIVDEALPAAVEAFPGIACDAYCERGAWSLDDTVRLFERAAALGCPIRVHTDQFTSLGATRWAIDHGAVTVDHLEAIDPADVAPLASSETIAVALPGSGFHLDGRYAPGRALVDAGAALAVATNWNPGSSPTPSMPLIIALACRELGLAPAEAITAATVNAARVLRREAETGTLEVGRRADLQLLDVRDERHLAFEIAAPGPRLVVAGGRVVHRRGV